MITEIKKDHLKKPLPTAFVLPKGFVYAGGSVRDSILNRDIKDYDIFSVSGIEAAEDLVDTIKEDKRYKILINAPNMLMFKFEDLIYQIILRDYHSVEDLLNSFDFSVCQFATDGTTIWADSEALIDIFTDHLSVVNINPEFAISSLQRAFKYADYGFKPCNGTVVDIVKALRVPTEEQLQKNIDFYPSGTRRILHFD